MNHGSHRLLTLSDLRVGRHSFLALIVWGCCTAASAGNCLVQNGQKIGDCDRVNVGTGGPLNVTSSGSYTGNFDRVSVQPGVRATISGNTGDVLVRSGSSLSLTGNSGAVRVEGVAELTGNTGPVFVAAGGAVTVRGIADSVSGPGRVVLVPGAIVGGVQVKAPGVSR